MADRLSPSTYRTGHDGETWVADWLLAQGGQLIAQRWRCRLGELDLVMRLPIGCPKGHGPVQPERDPWTLVFVEVKTRASGNWDANGLLAIGAQAQERLINAAQLFLAKHPIEAELPCRFDVALVRRSHRGADAVSGSEFSLQSYIWNAIQG
jgi:putative endonuclease